jgi:hypothetical protein
MRCTNRIRPRQRRGITAVLAMLYMTLFGTLALGFYASVTTAVQVSKNEQRAARTLAAAESGMAFMKYQLANLGVPAGTTQDQLFPQVYSRLKTRLEGYQVMVVDQMDPVSQSIQTVPAYVGQPDSETITIPDRGYGIKLDDQGTTFNVVIKKDQNGEKLKVSVYGKFRGNGSSLVSGRKTSLDYSVAKDAAKIFNFGVASKSAISMNGNVSIQGTPGNPSMGSVLSATTSTSVPLTMTGSSIISGDVSFSQPNPTLSISSNATIAGLKVTSSSFKDHVHSDVGEVPFPVIKTDAFEQFVPSAAAAADGTTVISSAKPPVGTTFKNIRIKAGSRVSFASNTTINGVLFIEADPTKPTSVSFSGQANLTGVIVVQTASPSLNINNENLDPSVNKISFGGGVTFKGVETLPATTDFPAELRALTGSMLLAPGFGVNFKGNFGSVGGSMFASQISYTGTSGGTIRGSVVQLKDTATPLTMSGTADLIVESQGTANYPAGVFFGSHYAPLPYTYAEGVQ